MASTEVRTQSRNRYYGFLPWQLVSQADSVVGTARHQEPPVACPWGLAWTFWDCVGFLKNG